MFPQRHAGAVGFQIPPGGFNRGLGHAMTTDSLHHIVNARRAFNLVPDYHRPEKLFERRPTRLRPLVRIERSFTAGTLAPTFRAVPVDDARQNDPPLSRTPKTGFEKMNQRQANFAQFDCFDINHGESFGAEIMPVSAALVSPPHSPTRLLKSNRGNLNGSSTIGRL